MFYLQHSNSRRGDAAGFVVFALAGCMIVTWLLGTLLYMVIPQSSKVATTSSSQVALLSNDSGGEKLVAMNTTDGESPSEESSLEEGASGKKNSDTPNSDSDSDSQFSSSMNVDAPNPTEEAVSGSGGKWTEDSEEAEESGEGFFKPSKPPESTPVDSDFNPNPGSGTIKRPSFVSPTDQGNEGMAEEVKPEFAVAPEDLTESSGSSEPSSAEPMFGKTTEPAPAESVEPGPAPKTTDVTEPGPSEALETPKPAEPIVYPMREFVSQNGGTATMAFVRWAEIPGNVIMRKDDGQLFRVPVDRFSETDQEYLNNIPKLIEE